MDIDNPENTHMGRFVSWSEPRSKYSREERPVKIPRGRVVSLLLKRNK